MPKPSYETALIVGAGSGLSASLARLFSREGMRVALAARNSEKLGALCAETGATAFACQRRARRPVARACPGRSRARPHGQRLWRFPRGSRGAGPDASEKARRDPL